MKNISSAVAADRQSRRAVFSKTRQLITKYNSWILLLCDTVMVATDVCTTEPRQLCSSIEKQYHKKLSGDMQELCGSLGRLRIAL